MDPSIVPQRAARAFWRAVGWPTANKLVAESTFDFYAHLIDARLRARRIIARVEAVREETRETRSLVLHANGHFRGFSAGQHVSVTVEIDGVRHTRAYSPSNAPDGRTIVLTIKRFPNGLVSRWLHERVGVGHLLELGAATGDLTLPSPAPAKLLLIAGGSGITPIMSMLRELCARSEAHDVVLIDYSRTYDDIAFIDELRGLAAHAAGVRAHFAVTRQQPARGDLSGRFSPSHVAQVAPDVRERHAFACGPRGLVDAVRAFWTEQGARAVLRTETFTPPELAARDIRASAAFRISAVRTMQSFTASATAPLLAEAERAGLGPVSGCRRGICSSCTCRKREGVVRNLVTGVVSAEPDEDIRLCVSAPLSDLTLEL